MKTLPTLFVVRPVTADSAPGERQLQCEGCGITYRIQNEVPIFIQENVVAVASDHLSNPIGADFEAILRKGNEFILHIGAGATAQKYPNCIEFEHKIFKHTDVVGDAHHLPFRDASFDRVFAFNVFEHLREPARAAAEIARVLKPTGAVAIHTAFLQAVHEEPAHFYNTTEYGLREWFADFEIEKLSVSPNFSPGMMLAYLMSSVLTVMQESGAAGREQAIVSGNNPRRMGRFLGRQNRTTEWIRDACKSCRKPRKKESLPDFELIGRKRIRG